MGDSGVIATNDDATACKRSASALGYWRDPFVKVFCEGLDTHRRPPLINRGYYARTISIQRMIVKMLARAPTAQIVSLGAGFDTLFWRLKAEGVRVARYVEVDHPSVIAHKQMLVQHSRLLSQALVDTAHPDAPPRYALIAADLRDVAALEAALSGAGLSKDAPTIFLCECVLVYMDPAHVAALLSWAAAMPAAAFLNYEPINATDAFGRMMLSNLQARGCPLLSLQSTPDAAAVCARLRGCGWARALAVDMNEAYALLPAAERQRVEKIEWLDELEEWRLINSHYVLSLATTGAIFEHVDFASE